MTTPETPSRPRRRLRYFLITLAAFVVTVAIFYAEEDLRGWRAMEQAKRELAAQGVILDWSKRIPAPVPENENVFGVPEMQKWFVRHDRKGTNELTQEMKYPGRDESERTVVAQLTIGLPGATPPVGAAVLRCEDSKWWGDSKLKDETIRLIKEAVGPVALDPGFPFYTKQPPGEIHPAQIFLQCQTQPAEKQLQGFLPAYIFNDHDESEKVRVENTGNGSYIVTMHTPSTAAEFLKWNEQLEPTFTLIRNALQRPYARMNGDYSEPEEMPIPAFVTIRVVAQRLGAMAQCHLLLGQPEEALRDLTLSHDICRRILEEEKPMTLVSAMINVAVWGLNAVIIYDGLQMHAWREPQLAALQAQLKQINLLAPVKQSLESERFGACYRCATLTPVQFFKLVYSDYDDPSKTNSWKHRVTLLPGKFIPRGWAWRNVVAAANFYTNVLDSIDPEHQLFLPEKREAARKQMDAIGSHWSPNTFMFWPLTPNFTRVYTITAKNQTMVNQALIACALERYHLAHGEYPETLDALIPQFIDAIPHDLIGGQPPHYRRNADGTFLLYSIGWSQQDHGGRAGDKDDCDLVWPEK